MIAVLLALALSNMPPPPPETCPKKPEGAACLTPRRSQGVCVKTQCPKTEFGEGGSKTVMVECMRCEAAPKDGGTK